MKLLCITKCPTGMVQTYVAAEQLESAAEALGYEIRTETHGAQGIGGEFTPEQIDEADYVIIASNTKVEKTTRFGNKSFLLFPWRMPQTTLSLCSDVYSRNLKHMNNQRNSFPKS